MEHLCVVCIRNKQYLLSNLKEIQEPILQLLNRKAFHQIGYFETEKDKNMLDAMEIEVKHWLDLHLDTIPIWTEDRK